MNVPLLLGAFLQAQVRICMGSTKDMSITVNGQTRVPPGFRFHPTEEELLNYYLRKKVAGEEIDLDVIPDVDLNKLEPWDIQEMCRIGSTPQNDWYFFSHKDRKYPTGTRTNRATAEGFWKATGRDKVIYASARRIGMRKTLVFYRGRAPHGQKSDWIMHEYRLDERHVSIAPSASCISMGERVTQDEGWVVCRVFRKKSYHKTLDSPSNSSSITGGKVAPATHPDDDATLDQILHYMGRSCKHELDNCNSSIPAGDSDIHLQYTSHPLDAGLKGPSHSNGNIAPHMGNLYCGFAADGSVGAVVSVDAQGCDNLGSDWTALDKLVASHLNGQSQASRPLGIFDDPGCEALCSAASRFSSADYERVSNGDVDLWAIAAACSASSSASDRLKP